MSDTDLSASNGPAPAAGLDPTLRLKLSIMMFLQYATWGAWWSVLNKYLAEIGFANVNIGRAYATTAIASIISPLIFGQIADRWVPTQYLLAGLHLAGAAALGVATFYTDFAGLYFWILLWAVLYVPTISLTNSLSLHQISDAARHFPSIRVFGTIGWIVAGLTVTVASLNERSTDPMWLAAAIGLALGLYCFALPHTPPRGRPGETWPPLRAIGMLREPQFALFISVSFIMAIVLAGYFTFCANYLAAPPRELEKAASIMTIGQFAEMLLLPLLPFFLRYLGMKWTLVIGMSAWGLRYAIFSLGHPTWLVIASLALHGVCYDFFFVAAYIHVDNRAHREIRASAQALFNFVTMGVGMLIGNELFGRLVDAYQTQEGAIQWRPVWAYPAVGVVICMLIFVAGFRGKKAQVPIEAHA